jgi:hypothetical protein
MELLVAGEFTRDRTAAELVCDVDLDRQAHAAGLERLIGEGDQELRARLLEAFRVRRGGQTLTVRHRVHSGEIYRVSPYAPLEGRITNGKAYDWKVCGPIPGFDRSMVVGEYLLLAETHSHDSARWLLRKGGAVVATGWCRDLAEAQDACVRALDKIAVPEIVWEHKGNSARAIAGRFDLRVQDYGCDAGWVLYEAGDFRAAGRAKTMGRAMQAAENEVQGRTPRRPS